MSCHKLSWLAPEEGEETRLLESDRILSNTRGFPSFVRTSSVRLRVPPPWILKRGGVESSGRRLISSIGKSKRIAFFFFKEKIYFQNFEIFWNKVIFPDFSRFFFSGFGWTGELWSNCVFLILRNKEDFLKVFFGFFLYF